MMKKFLLVVCGSFVGVTLALIVFTLSAVVTSFAIIGAMGAGEARSIDDNSILHITLKGAIPERDGMADVSVTDLVRGVPSPPSLATLKAAIAAAASSDKVDGIYIDCQGASANPATLYELRKSLADFKKTGKNKFIYAYGGQAITQGDYYVASVADSIFLNPIGAVDVHGLAAVIPSYKGLLDKLGVEMQVVRVGTFKSAVEPYILDSISPANRLQQQHYMGSIWDCMASQMAESRKIKRDAFNRLADTLLLALPADSLVRLHVVDALCYKSEMESRLRRMSDINEGDDLRLVDPAEMADSDTGRGGKQGEIAVLYAVGEIDGARAGGDGIDSDDLIDQIKELRDDDDVKGLVLRVNSPGGSAYGSEQIWKALDDFKRSGKPLAVSMGDLAASGGYYISCGADRIFAEPVTITGSIGIFGMVPNLGGLFTDKLGVRFSVVKTNKNSDFGNFTKPLTPVQRAMMQTYVNRGYELFTKRCADGRDMRQDSIKAIAEGRVWDGRTALSIGLVDEFGGIDAAVCYVAAKASLKSGQYATRSYPADTDRIERLLKHYGAGAAESRLSEQMGIFYSCYASLKRIMARDKILCLMEPMEVK